MTMRGNGHGLSAAEIADWAGKLMHAEALRTPIPKLSTSAPDACPGDAYRIQLEVAHRRAESGDTLAGMKVGLTSKAMQELAGVMEPDYGHLWQAMRVEDGGEITFDTLIQPQIEPELAFVLGQPLGGPGATADDVLEVTACVAASLEIVDSRFVDWRISWVDTVADNGSSARFIIGGVRVPPRQLVLAELPLVFERNGEIIDQATLGEVMGNPAESVAWLANTLAGYGFELPAGAIVLPGAPCRAVRAAAGDAFVSRIEGVGTASVRFA